MGETTKGHRAPRHLSSRGGRDAECLLAWCNKHGREQLRLCAARGKNLGWNWRVEVEG